MPLDPSHVSAVVPAAGLSRRMGGPNKLLLPWEGGTIVGCVVRTLLQCVDQVVVVTGRDADEVAAATPGAEHVFNARFEEGLGTSLATGAAACRTGNAFLIALGDMPSLTAETMDLLLAAYEEDGDIVAPVYGSEPDRTGHPVLFGPAYRGELEALRGDQGARPVITAHPAKLLKVAVRGFLLDIDGPADVNQPNDRD